MSRIQEQLKDWVQRAYNFYEPKAKTLNIDYYTQSALNVLEDDTPVELMIIGINPGYGGDYQPNRFKSAKDILKGNCIKDEEGYYNIHVNITEWALVKKLQRILGDDFGDILNNESRYVLTNATFFSTRKEEELDNGEIKKAQEESVEFTKELIRIINPNRIICLGGENGAKILGVKARPVLNKVAICLGYDSKTFGIPTYCIKHTSGARWTNEELYIVGACMCECFKRDQSQTEFDFAEIENDLSRYIEVFNERREERNSRKEELNMRFMYILKCLSNFCYFDLDLPLNRKEKAWSKYDIPNTNADVQIVAQKGTQHIALHNLSYQERDKLRNSEIFAKCKWNDDWKLPFNRISNSTDEVISKGKEIIKEILRILSGE